MTIQVVTPAVIGDGAIINGVAHFVRSSAPSTRIGGASLVANDRCYRTDLNISTFFNGSYWLSEQLYSIGSAGAGSGIGVTVSTGSYATRSFLDLPATITVTNSSLFFTNWVVELRANNTTHNSTNYYTVEAGCMTAGVGSLFTGISTNTQDIGGGARTRDIQINQYFASQSPNAFPTIQRLWLQGFGTAPSFRIYSTLYYRLVV